MKIFYSDAFLSLQKIVSDIESGETGIDELAKKVKEASQLIAICRKKLYAVETEVRQILEKASEE